MFSMNDVGRKIGELRKKHNMTQMELADKMGISFQAVSNWERGNSMPDISKLPELAELFHVSIDELLGESSELLRSAATGKIDEYLEHNSIDFGELNKVAQILKPNQVNLLVNNANTRKLSDIEDILPFIGNALIDQLMEKAVLEKNYDDLEFLAPFASKSVLNDIARTLIKEGSDIRELAPFIDKDILCDYATSLFEASGADALDDIAPFLPKELLLRFAEQEYEQNGLHHFDAIAPFVDRNYLNQLAEQAIEKEGIKAISNIAPFISKEILIKYVKERYL